jgi:hypothetical protein
MRRTAAGQLSTLFVNLRPSRLLGRGLFLLAFFHLTVQLAVVVPRELTRTDRNRDVTIYYQAAKDAYNNRAIYEQYPNFGPDHLPQNYDYAPPFAAVIAPLGAMSFAAFCKVWFCLLLLAFWTFAFCLARLFKGSETIDIRDVLIWGLFAGLFPGTYAAIGIGNIDPLLWALFAAGLLGIARPTLWALAVIVKVFYIWPLIADVAATARRANVKVLLRSLAPGISIMGMLIVYGGVICGWQSYIVWIRDVLPTLSQGNFQPNNVSISFGALRLARFLGWQYSGGPLPLLAHLWLVAASIGAPLITWWFSRRFSTQIKCACIIAASVLFAPVCWTCYLPLLLPLIALLFQRKNCPAC